MNGNHLFPRKDLTGLRFDKLIVIKFEEFRISKAGHRKPFWKCQCDCGAIKIAQGCSLKNKHIRSCGCLLVNNYRTLGERLKISNAKPKGVAAFNGLINSYKQRAKKNKLSFELTDDEFKKLIYEQCFYCGVGPLQKWPSDGCKKVTNGVIFYNGIDRSNSDIGYTINNTVPACMQCNLAKLDYSQKEFLMWIEKLIKFNKNRVTNEAIP